MTNIEIITRLKDGVFTDEDGGKVNLVFKKGLTPSEIEQLRAQFPNKTIDNELLEILEVTQGWDGTAIDMVAFDSIGEFGAWDLIPYSITLGHDGFGNYWVLDINSQGQLGKVFYACHDPFVLVIHSQSLNEYLHHYLEFCTNPSASYINKIHEQTVVDILEQQNNCASKELFLEHNPEYSEFLSQFDEDWTVADLRLGMNGSGFAWGNFDSRFEAKRHPTDLVWVFKNKNLGLLARLFGKK